MPANSVRTSSASGRASGIARTVLPTKPAGRYTYQKLEKGESKPGAPANPTVKTLLAISQVLGVELTSLLPDGVPDLTAK